MSAVQSSWACVQPHHRARPSRRSPSVPSSEVDSQEEESLWPLGKLTSPGLAGLPSASLSNSQPLKTNSHSAGFRECCPPFFQANRVGHGPPAHCHVSSAFLSSMQASACLLVSHCQRAVLGNLGPQSEFKEPLRFVPSSSC